MGSQSKRRHFCTLALACAILAVCSLCLVSLSVPAYAEELPEEQEVPPANPHAAEPELLEAKACVLMDQAGNVLYQRNATQELPPASTTKVMSAMVVLDSGRDLDDVITIVEKDLGEGGQLADYGNGDKVSLRELLEVMLVYSGNDAAYNAALAAAGTEEDFVDLMNQKAKEIGMEHTHFVNPHGMDEDGHYSCALDLAIMGRYALEHYPLIGQLCVHKEVTTTVRGYETVLHTYDVLLDSFNGIRGIKSGAVENNFTFVGASGRGPVQLYSGVLGCTTALGRFDDTARLMEWGYAHFDSKSYSHPNWVVRTYPYAFDLGQSVVLTTRAARGKAQVWQKGDSIGYSTTLGRPGRLLGEDALFGWTTWTQDKRPLQTATYRTRGRTERVSSWPIFTLPLFEDTDLLGEER